MVACPDCRNRIGAAQALAEDEQAVFVHIWVAADIIQGGIAVGKQSGLIRPAFRKPVAPIVEKEDVVTVRGQPLYGFFVGGKVLGVAVEMDDGGTRRYQAAGVLCRDEPAVQAGAVFALKEYVFMLQSGLGWCAVVGVVGIIKRLLGAGRQAEQRTAE